MIVQDTDEEITVYRWDTIIFIIACFRIYIMKNIKKHDYYFLLVWIFKFFYYIVQVIPGTK